MNVVFYYHFDVYLGISFRSYKGSVDLKLLVHCSLAEQLREMKEDISTRKFATVVLGSLPESYDNFLTSLNARNDEELDWDNIKGLLIEEYLKRKEKNNGSKTQDSALFAKKKPSFDRGRNQEYGRIPEISRGGRVQDHMSPDKFQQTAARRGVQNKGGIVCYKCNQVGHIVRNCPLNRNNSKGEHSNVAEGGDVALIFNVLNQQMNGLLTQEQQST